MNPQFVNYFFFLSFFFFFSPPLKIFKKGIQVFVCFLYRKKEKVLLSRVDVLVTVPL